LDRVVDGTHLCVPHTSCPVGPGLSVWLISMGKPAFGAAGSLYAAIANKDKI